MSLHTWEPHLAPQGFAHTESTVSPQSLQPEGTAGPRPLELGEASGLAVPAFCITWAREKGSPGSQEAMQISGSSDWQVQQIWLECFLEKTSPQAVS